MFERFHDIFLHNFRLFSAEEMRPYGRIFFHIENICVTYCNKPSSPLLHDLSQSSPAARVAFTFSIKVHFTRPERNGTKD
jgi:hypothetical protein